MFEPQTDEEQARTAAAIEAPQGPSPLIWLWLCASLLTGCISLWINYSDLFQVPADVAEGRQKFAQVHRSFPTHAAHWHTAWIQLLHDLHQASARHQEDRVQALLQKVNTPILLAAVMHELDISKDRFKTLAFVPKSTSSSLIIVVSKPVYTFYFLPTILSLEIECAFIENRIHCTIVRLRRGSRELSPSTAWLFFGPELQALQRFRLATIRAV